MPEFGLYSKEGTEIIVKKSFDSLKEAYEFFSQIKQMPLNIFKKIFIVRKL